MDVFGLALNAYFSKRDSTPLILHNSYDAPEEMPVDVFFREKQDMSEIEQKALSLCRGRILDIGAGVGVHTLELQKMDKDVTALEISLMATEIMKKRGVKKIVSEDIFKYQALPFDTLLLMMNGIGIAESLQGLSKFLRHADTLLAENGQIVFDSSDIRYLYEAEIPIPTATYYGEIQFKYEYKQQKGAWFNWLYIDFKTLSEIAKKEGWKSELILEDESDQYLARLIRT